MVALSSRREQLDELSLKEVTMLESQIRVGIDIGYKSHRVAIADPDGEIVE